MRTEVKEPLSVKKKMQLNPLPSAQPARPLAFSNFSIFSVASCTAHKEVKGIEKMTSTQDQSKICEGKAGGKLTTLGVSFSFALLPPSLPSRPESKHKYNRRLHRVISMISTTFSSLLLTDHPSPLRSPSLPSTSSSPPSPSSTLPAISSAQEAPP